MKYPTSYKYPTTYNIYLDYFNNMAIGQKLAISEARNPEALKDAVKMCIDIGCPIEVEGEWEYIRRVRWDLAGE